MYSYESSSAFISPIIRVSWILKTWSRARWGQKLAAASASSGSSAISRPPRYTWPPSSRLSSRTSARRVCSAPVLLLHAWLVFVVLRVRQASWWAASFLVTRCSRTMAGGGPTCTRRARCSSCARSLCSRTPSSPSASCSFFSYAAVKNYCRSSAVHISNLSHVRRTPHPTTKREHVICWLSHYTNVIRSCTLYVVYLRFSNCLWSRMIHPDWFDAVGMDSVEIGTKELNAFKATRYRSLCVLTYVRRARSACVTGDHAVLRVVHRVVPSGARSLREPERASDDVRRSALHTSTVARHRHCACLVDCRNQLDSADGNAGAVRQFHCGAVSALHRPQLGHVRPEPKQYASTRMPHVMNFLFWNFK